MNEENGREILVLIEVLKNCTEAVDGNFRELVRNKLTTLLELVPTEEKDCE